MALSNYDIAAWDKFGDPRLASMDFPGKIRVEIYKDWVYVYDKSQRGFFIDINNEATTIGPDNRNMSVIHLSEGKLTYKNIYIRVERRGTTENAGAPVFVHAMYDGGYNKYNKFVKCDPQILCGIGKYGFDGHSWIGITEEDTKWFAQWLYEIDSPIQEIKSAKPYNQGDAFFCGHDIAMERYGKSNTTIFGKMLGMDKKET